MNIISKLLIILCFTNILNASVQSHFFQEKSLDFQTLKKIKSWNKMIILAKDKKLLKKLEIVNNYFNKISYKSDINNWKKNDYWATPFEFISTGFGDCEDYAIAKYFTLQELGIKEEKLKLIYTRLVKNNQAHIVLAYSHKPNNIPIILDNVNTQLQLSNKRKDLKKMQHIEAQAIFDKFRIQLIDKIYTKILKN